MKNAFLITLYLFISSGLLAQINIEGKVTEAGTQLPLLDVHVQVVGSYFGTTSDNEGHFHMAVNKEPPFMLKLSYIGYESQFIEIREETMDMDVVMNSKPYTSNEIIVTPQHREQQLQEVPLSVSVVDQAFLKSSSQMNDVGDLIQFIPGFSGKPVNATVAEYTIRGINRSTSWGALASSSTAVILDGVYFGGLNEAARDFIDVQRIEVLKGPQSTLFGHNSSAGVISVHSNKPVFTNQLNTELRFGNWGQKEMNLVLNTPLNEKLAIRYAGEWGVNDGNYTITNQNDLQVGDRNSLTNRISLLWKPGYRSSYLLSVEQQRNRTGERGVKNLNSNLGSSTDQFERTHQLNFPNFNKTDFITATLNSKWLINDQLSLHSITALGSSKIDIKTDGDASPTDFFKFGVNNDAISFTQELRLSGQTEKSDWLLASRFYSQKNSGNTFAELNDFVIIPVFFGPFGIPADFCDGNPLCLESNEEISFNDLDYISYGIYGNFNYSISEKLNATFGLRLSIDNKKYDGHLDLGTGAIQAILMSNFTGQPGVFIDEKTWSAWQPRASIDYRVDEDIMLYSSYSRGYIAGGYALNNPDPFEAEKSDAFELGIKTNFRNDRIKLNLAGYYINYHDLQVQSLINRTPIVTNAGSVISKGIELESSAGLSDAFQLILNVGLNNSEYQEYIFPSPEPGNPDNMLDFSHSKVNRNPEFQFSSVLQFSKELSNLGTFQSRLDFSYQSDSYISRMVPEEFIIEDYATINLMAGINDISSGKIDIGIYINNLTNSNYINWVGASNFGPGYAISLPRMYGFKLRYNMM